MFNVILVKGERSLYFCQDKNKKLEKRKQAIQKVFLNILVPFIRKLPRVSRKGVVLVSRIYIIWKVPQNSVVDV